MKYGVMTAPGRFISWCDDKWYETTKDDLRPFTKEEALQCIQQLVEHFQYHVTLVSDEGEQAYAFGKPVTEKVTMDFSLGLEPGDFRIM